MIAEQHWLKGVCFNIVGHINSMGQFSIELIIDNTTVPKNKSAVVEILTFTFPCGGNTEPRLDKHGFISYFDWEYIQQLLFNFEIPSPYSDSEILPQSGLDDARPNETVVAVE